MKRVSAVCLLVILSLLTVPLAGSGVFGGTSDGLVVATTDESPDNETVRHQNPDAYDEQAGETAPWLSEELSARLGESTVSISDGEYERARDLLGEEYQQQLEQFVELEGEGDDGTTTDPLDDTDEPEENNTYRMVADTQTEYTDTLEEYNTTEDEYEQTLETGDVDAAREVARELSVQFEEIESLTETLIGHYDTLEDETDDDFEEQRTSIIETTEEINATQTAIEAEVFVETDLEFHVDEQPLSFLEPLEIQGQFEAADGTLPADGDIHLEIEETTYRGEIDDDGTFDAFYRPVQLPVGAENVTISYVPAPTSTHLPTETTVPVSLEQTDAEVDIDDHSRQLAYNEPGTINGTVEAEAGTVDDLQLEVTLDGESVADPIVEDGAFEAEFSVPAAVEAGEVELQVTSLHDDRAVVSETETVTTTIDETETHLEVTGEQSGDDVSVTGHFETADGDGIGGKELDIGTNTTAETTATTDDEGRFETTVETPTEPDDELLVTAAYSDDRSNLADVTAETVVSVTASVPSDEPTSTTAIPWVGLLFGGTLVVTGVGIAIWYRRRSDNERSPEDTDPDPAFDRDEQQRSTPSPRPYLSQSSAALEAGNADDAVEAAYLAARQTLGSNIETQDRLTHREFYQQYATSNPEEQTVSIFQELTQRYERAVFAVEQCSIDDARAACQWAEDLIEVNHSTPSSADD